VLCGVGPKRLRGNSGARLLWDLDILPFHLEGPLSGEGSGEQLLGAGFLVAQERGGLGGVEGRVGWGGGGGSPGNRMPTHYFMKRSSRIDATVMGPFGTLTNYANRFLVGSGSSGAEKGIRQRIAETRPFSGVFGV